MNRNSSDKMINSNGTQQNEKEEQKQRKRNPILNASLFSKFLFLWQRQLFSIGLKRTIEEGDIYVTLDNHRSCCIGGQFDKLWRRETIQNPHKPSFLKVIVRLFGLRVLGFGLLYTTLDVICRFVLPPFNTLNATYTPLNPQSHPAIVSRWSGHVLPTRSDGHNERGGLLLGRNHRALRARTCNYHPSVHPLRLRSGHEDPLGLLRHDLPEGLAHHHINGH